jgi:peptidoglycan/LPS O-acetylase OafA/YrhL
MKKITVLESVRGLAALYIFLAHFAISHLLTKSSPFGFFVRFGQEAVMLFFLLSGFVIYYSSQKHGKQSFADYFHRRAVRIYPIYLFSLLVSYLVACQSKGMLLPFAAEKFLGNFFMLQDLGRGKPGVWFETFYGNIALWSLAYEWWFYMLFFPINRFIEPALQKWVVFALALMGFISYITIPNQIGLYLNYFVIWWMGVELAKIYCSGERPTLQKMAVPLAQFSFFTALYFIYLLYFVKVAHKRLAWGLHPLLELRHFAFGLLIVVVALLFTPSTWTRLSKIIGPFAYFAPISYALYLLHYPLGCIGKYLSSINSFPLQMLSYIVVTFAAAYFAEFVLQKWANQGIKRLTKPTS